MRKTIITHSRKNEPVLLRDILPKVLRDIRLRMIVKKAIESRANAGSCARGKVRNPERMLVLAREAAQFGQGSRSARPERNISRHKGCNMVKIYPG